MFYKFLFLINSVTASIQRDSDLIPIDYYNYCTYQDLDGTIYSNFSPVTFSLYGKNDSSKHDFLPNLIIQVNIYCYDILQKNSNFGHKLNTIKIFFTDYLVKKIL